MRKLFAPFVMSFVLLATGCATVKPEVALSDKFMQQPEQATVGIHIDNLDKADFYLDGQVGLLDLAVINAATSELRSHLETLDITEFNSVEQQIGDLLESSGYQVTSIETEINTDKLGEFKERKDTERTVYASYDYTGFSDSLKLDYLLAIDVLQAGTTRSYYGFMPLNDPQPIFNVKVQLIDTHTNQLLWNKTIEKLRVAEGAWDEPPHYPGLTKALYAALENARHDIVSRLRADAAKAKQQLVVNEKPETATEADKSTL